ncbi:MAG TPA: DHH family phosphoesterase [Smithellaceae bacterium]|nr:DHH family phosphoesterase [Smithellaceae bacterium]
MKIKSILIKPETENNLARLLNMVEPDDSLAILIHGSPDPDAIACGMALREILRQTKGLSRCAFVSTDPTIRQQNIELTFAMHINIQLIDKIDINSFRLLALVDAQPSFLRGALSSLRPHMVFDHHPRGEEWSALLEDVRPSYGALSTVLTEYLLCARVKIPRNLHTALLYGIKTDTSNFDRATTMEDISSYTYHTRYANMQLIRRIELNQTPVRFLKYFDHAFHHMKNYRGRRTCFLGQVESADACVQVADFFLRIIGTYYVVIAGLVEEKLCVIFRGDGYRQDCGSIAKKAFGSFGKGGGHRSAARMEIPIAVLKQLAGDSLSQQSIDEFLFARLKRDYRHGSRQGEQTPAGENI